MNCIIPFESKVSFKNPVKEICSISLEHEITKNSSEILGNFFVSGTYKEHELSVNTSDFKFTIPFSVELTNRIDEDSLEFSIDNFTYDLIGNDLEVKIDYVINADDVREEVKPIDEVIPDDPLELITEVPNTDLKQEPEKESSVVENTPEERNSVIEKIEKDEISKEEEREEVNPEIISIVKTDDDFITYHIHVVKATETIESIAMEYKIDKDDLMKINNISEIMENDKLLIPLKNE